MIVEDKIRVLGRGWVIISETDEPPTISDEIKVNGKIFGIVGIERWYTKRLGLVLRPNDEVNETISIGDNMEIIKRTHN
jgi:hypothetical protein